MQLNTEKKPCGKNNESSFWLSSIEKWLSFLRCWHEYAYYNLRNRTNAGWRVMESESERTTAMRWMERDSILWRAKGKMIDICIYPQLIYALDVRLFAFFSQLSTSPAWALHAMNCNNIRSYCFLGTESKLLRQRCCRHNGVHFFPAVLLHSLHCSTTIARIKCANQRSVRVSSSIVIEINTGNLILIINMNAHLL